MAPEHVLDVEWRRPEPIGDGVDLGRGHEQEHGARVDEAADQPRAGDAVDLGSRAGHPDGPALLVARRQLGRRHQGQPGLGPGLESAGQCLGGATRMANPGGCTLAELATTLADGNSRAADQCRCPVRCDRGRAANRSWDQSRIGGKILLGAHIEDRRGLWAADQPAELVHGDGGERRHGASSSHGGTRCFGMSPRGEIAIPMNGELVDWPRPCQRDARSGADRRRI